jgi:hypothetical protein
MSSDTAKNLENLNNNNLSIDSYYENALQNLKDFFKEESKEKLISAADNFLKEIELKKNLPESYLWLAYIFHIFEMDNFSLKYFNLAGSISPDGEAVQKFKEALKVIPKDTEKQNIVDATLRLYGS